MFEGFTPEARTVIDDSQLRAAELGCDHAGTEHLLWALAGAQVGISAGVLGDLGASETQIREAVASATACGEARPWDQRHRWTVPAKRMLEMSLRQMLERDDPKIQPEHMLLAATLVETGGVSVILDRLGVSFERVEARVTERRSRSLICGP